MSSENSRYKLIHPSGEFNKSLLIPSSKSYSNRALILGAIRGANFTIENISQSTDVLNLLSCLRNIGLKIDVSKDKVVFKNSFPECEKEILTDVIDLYTGDGGTTNRFLIGLLSRGSKKYRLYPSEKMNERPIDDLLLPLKNLGVSIQLNHSEDKKIPWVEIQGPPVIDEKMKVVIDCLKSTQFASSLLLAFSNTKLNFEFKDLHSSKTYLDMTKEVIKQANVKNHYFVPMDFSSASYFMALGALQGSVLIENCFNKDRFQADSVFLDLLNEIGASVEFTPKGLRVAKFEKLRGFNFDVRKAPDLFPTLVFLASYIEDKSVLENLDILKYKESDRIVEMLKILDIFSVKYFYENQQESLIINGSNKKTNIKPQVTPARDHRIIMAASLFLKNNSGGNVGEWDCVDKSFPDFFNSF